MEEFYPPVGFYFSVKFSGVSNKNDAKFQEVSGISATLQTQRKKRGGYRNPATVPMKTTYSNLKLKRGFLKDSEVTEWVRDALVNLKISLKDVEVTLLNEQGQPLSTWSFINAYPVKWEIDAFNSTKNQVALETLELTYEFFKQI